MINFISVKMVAFVICETVTSSYFLILNQKSDGFLLATILWIFINNIFLENCMIFSLLM